MMTPDFDPELLTHLDSFDQSMLGDTAAQYEVDEYHHHKLASAAAEIERRDKEALRIYRPNKFQDAYHASMVKECVAVAANQVGKLAPRWEPILTPKGFVPFGTICVGDTVIDGLGDRTTVTQIFPQGEKEIFRVTFDDGSYTHCGREHLWKCKSTKGERYGDVGWAVRNLDQIIAHGGMEPIPTRRTMIPTAVCHMDSQEVPVDPYTLGVLLGDGCLSHGSVNVINPDADIIDALVLPDGCDIHTNPSARVNLEYAITRIPGQSNNPMLDELRLLGIQGCRSWEKFIPEVYLHNSVTNRLALLRGLMDTDGNCTTTGCPEYCTTSPRLAEQIVWLVQSLGGKCKVQWRVTRFTDANGNKKDGRPSARIRLRMWYANPFQLQRKSERWKRPTSRQDGRFIYKIEPIGIHDSMCISVESDDHTYITRDFIVTHNSLAGYIEDARAACGCDPYDKYPKKNGIMAIVVYKESQIALNTHRYLLQSGAFDIIRDKETGIWTTYKPWVPEHAARADEREPAPPLIPRRLIKRVHWKSKMGNVINRIDMENGWEIHVFSSTAKPDAGFQADLVHIDEDIANAEWYVEMLARLSIRKGLLRWTALPLFDNDTLPRIVERGDDEAEAHQRGGPKPTTEVVRATIYDNPYITEETREENIKRWRAEGEDVYRQRALGELITDTVRMYPTFSRSVHAVQRYAESHKELFGKYLASRQVPDDWCLRLFIDPGHSIAAGLLVATPPDESFHLAVREIYQQRCDATILATLIKEIVGERWLQSLLIDAHGGRLTGIGDGRKPQAVYESELERLGVSCIDSGHRFRSACDDIDFRVTTMRQRLIIRPGLGLPEFLYDEQHCPNLEKEMVRFRKTKVGGVVTDKANRKAPCHAVECFEYASAEELTYIAPPSRRSTETAGQRRVRQWKERQSRKRKSAAGMTGVLHGGIDLSASYASNSY